MLDDTFIKKLKDAARRETWDDADDFNPCDHSGGNFDDAYFGGQADGETHLAREILDKLGIKY
jgi:hypothetical protein